MLANDVFREALFVEGYQIRDTLVPLEPLIETSRAKLERTHPTLGERARWQVYLVPPYAIRGRVQESLDILKRAAPLLQAEYGKAHPWTLHGYDYLATTYEVLGQHAQALPIRERLLAIEVESLGPDHGTV